jgi:hypothetical protein
MDNGKQHHFSNVFFLLQRLLATVNCTETKQQDSALFHAVIKEDKTMIKRQLAFVLVSN